MALLFLKRHLSSKYQASQPLPVKLGDIALNMLLLWTKTVKKLSQAAPNDRLPGVFVVGRHRCLRPNWLQVSSHFYQGLARGNGADIALHTRRKSYRGTKLPRILRLALRIGRSICTTERPLICESVSLLITDVILQLTTLVHSVTHLAQGCSNCLGPHAAQAFGNTHLFHYICPCSKQAMTAMSASQEECQLQQR